MATVPNNSTFALSDVVAVVGGSDLVAAFANASAGGFDGTYSGSKNSLLNFRNYNSVFLKISNNSCRYHYNQPPYDTNNFTVTHSGTYTYAWSSGAHFTYSKSGDVFTVTAIGNNTSGTPWGDSLTITQGALTAVFSVVQFVSPS